VSVYAKDLARASVMDVMWAPVPAFVTELLSASAMELVLGQK
jgi:hypothetical protein